MILISKSEGARLFFVRLGLILLIILQLYACADSPTQGEGGGKREMVLPVEIGKVEFRDIVDEVRAVGNIIADQRVTLTAEVRGKLVEFPVKEGQRLHAGDLIAQVDPREYRLQVDRLRAELISSRNEYDKTKEGARPEDRARLKAQLQATQSTLNLAKKEEQRFRQLKEEGVVSQSQYDEKVDRLKQAEENHRASEAELEAGEKGREEDVLKAAAQLESVTKQLELMELNLEKTAIIAPFDGTLLRRTVEVGAYVSDGDAVGEMIGASALKAVIELPQGYRSRLNELTGIEFEVPELGLKFKENSRLKSRVRIIPDANIFSGNIQAQVELSRPDRALFPGVTLEARLKFNVRRQVKHVPSISLVIGEQGTVVYAVKEGKAHLIPVKSGLERDGWVEVTDFTRQLNKTTQLIIRGSGAVFPGAKVMPTIGGGPPGGGPPGGGPPQKGTSPGNKPAEPGKEAGSPKPPSTEAKGQPPEKTGGEKPAPAKKAS